MQHLASRCPAGQGTRQAHDRRENNKDGRSSRRKFPANPPVRHQEFQQIENSKHTTFLIRDKILMS
jgi:hypothetical protein